MVRFSLRFKKAVILFVAILMGMTIYPFLETRFGIHAAPL